MSKPFSPESFLKAFDHLTKKWSSGYLQELRGVGSKIVAGNRRAALEKLTQLYRQDPSHPLVDAALAHQYRKLGKVLLAEKVLFSAIQKGNFDMTAVLPLLETFIHNAKPENAEKLANMVMKRFADPTFMSVTMVQIFLMQNKVKETIPHLKAMIDKGYFPEVAKDYLPKVYYSCGMVNEFHEAIKQKAHAFDSYQTQWHTISPEDAARRKAQFEALVKKRRAEHRAEMEIAHGKPVSRRRKSRKVTAPIGKPLLPE